MIKTETKITNEEKAETCVDGKTTTEDSDTTEMLTDGSDDIVFISIKRKRGSKNVVSVDKKQTSDTKCIKLSPQNCGDATSINSAITFDSRDNDVETGSTLSHPSTPANQNAGNHFHSAANQNYGIHSNATANQIDKNPCSTRANKMTDINCCRPGNRVTENHHSQPTNHMTGNHCCSASDDISENDYTPTDNESSEMVSYRKHTKSR